MQQVNVGVVGLGNVGLGALSVLAGNAAQIASKPTSATQGTVRAIWESLDRPYRAAMQQNLIYTRLGNPIGRREVAEHGPDRPEPRLR